AAVARSEAEAWELVAAARGETAGDGLVIAAEDGDAELPRGHDRLVARRRFRDADQDQRRTQRQRRERGHGQAVVRSLVLGGDDGDAAGEVREGVLELGVIDGHDGGSYNGRC